MKPLTFFLSCVIISVTILGHIADFHRSFGACGGIPSSPADRERSYPRLCFRNRRCDGFGFHTLFTGVLRPVNSAKTGTAVASVTGAVAIANAFGCVPPGPLRERKTYAGGHRTQCRVAFASYFL